MQNNIKNSDLINTIDIINQYLLGNENIQSLQETISKLNNKINK
jgi:hypothetical protein